MRNPTPFVTMTTGTREDELRRRESVYPQLHRCFVHSRRTLDCEQCLEADAKGQYVRTLSGEYLRAPDMNVTTYDAYLANKRYGVK